MRHSWIQTGTVLLAILSTQLLIRPGWSAEPSHPAAGDATAPKTRTFQFDFGATIHGLPQGGLVRVWLPVPPSNEHQRIEVLEQQLPGTAEKAIEPKYGNEILSFSARAPLSAKLEFRVSYLVRRKEVRGLSNTGRQPAELTNEELRLFLKPNSRVPIDGQPLRLLSGLQVPQDPVSLGRLLYDRVDQHVRYDKSQPGYGNGDVLWVCDSRFGNCTDFHSLFISLARSRNLPARFEIGFPLPPERGKGKVAGYHCWAFFFAAGRGWIPVDISEADKHPEMKEYYFGNLTEDRVTFSSGRDIVLAPKQSGPPLNFFVYPYVEVDGEPWPPEKVEYLFAHCDLP
jgi:transglutaminase-like putative cysteine protease